MDPTIQTTPLEKTQQSEPNSQPIQPPTRRKLNWKGFFVGIIVAILIEIFAVHALNNGYNQKQVTAPKPIPPISKEINNATANWKTFSDNSFSIRYPSNWTTNTSTDFTRLNNEKKIAMIYDGKMNNHACNSNKPYPSRFVIMSSVDTQESPKEFAIENNTWGDENLKAELIQEMDIKNYSINNISGVIYNETGACGRGQIIALSNGQKIFLLNISVPSSEEDSLIDQILSTFKFTDQDNTCTQFINNISDETTDNQKIENTVKSFYCQWLNPSQTGDNAELFVQNGYLTQKAANAIKQTNYLDSDPVSCSQNPLPYNSYTFTTPVVNGTNATMQISGKYSGPPLYNMVISVHLSKANTQWKIDNFTCPSSH